MPSPTIRNYWGFCYKLSQGWGASNPLSQNPYHPRNAYVTSFESNSTGNPMKLCGWGVESNHPTKARGLRRSHSYPDSTA